MAIILKFFLSKNYRNRHIYEIFCNHWNSYQTHEFVIIIYIICEHHIESILYVYKYFWKICDISTPVLGYGIPRVIGVISFLPSFRSFGRNTYIHTHSRKKVLGFCNVSRVSTHTYMLEVRYTYRRFVFYHRVVVAGVWYMTGLSKFYCIYIYAYDIYAHILTIYIYRYILYGAVNIRLLLFRKKRRVRTCLRR